MMELISQFHFLRPLWLLMLLPCFLLVLFLLKQQQTQGNWTKVIAPELLPWLLEGDNKKPVRWPLILVLSGWVVTCLAMAGPTWIKQPVPISKNQHPLVVAVDLSFNMFAADLSPNRLTRARFKLQDLFNLRSEGLSALVAYAGSAHTVAPLTDDNRTLNNLVKALSPDVMPVPGNNPVDAIRLAKELITQGSNEPGDILLVTGSISEAQAEQITDLLKDSPLRLSILGTGTEQGAPIPLPKGGYLKDKQGAIVVPQLDQDRLQALAKANGGRYQTMTLADTDLKALVPATSNKPLFSERESADQTLEQWYDAGYWLVWLLLPTALFGFRRGWLMMVMITLLPVTQEAKAFSWDDLWQTRNQQGQKALQAGDPAKAADLFENPAWKAQALFENHEYEAAADILKNLNDAESDYNRGNALAKAGNLEESIEAYKKALAKNPELKDAAQNLEKVTEELQKKKREEEQQGQGGDGGQQNQSNQKQQSGQKDPSGQQQDSGENEGLESQPSDYQQDPNGKHQQESSLPPESQSSSSKETMTPDEEGQQQSQKESSAEQSEKSADSTAKQAKPTDQNSADNQTGKAVADSLNDQPLSPEQQAIESWLRTIPDDPGGLLRRKFLQQQRALQQKNIREGASW
ncbi:VWA domain-containing protein [Endozoicomonas elysicola]|uniref:VWFA domain-containing protein n=1 Tax=Endozoicomonas elysicola TaxID=305900 RepID=A0A081KDF0_9GAMM|nr:VWA domain-containing protein [Endozoicomonas elysicola]KEI72176.1 hypothetical protein GV64_16870 [Endozoicomonas elysicola]